MLSEEHRRLWNAVRGGIRSHQSAHPNQFSSVNIESLTKRIVGQILSLPDNSASVGGAVN